MSELEIGDTLKTASRTVTIDDIEHLLLIAQFGLFYDIGMILIYVFLYFCIFRYVATYVLLQDARCGSLGD